MNRKTKLLLLACALAGLLIGRYLWQPTGRYALVRSDARASCLVLDTRTGALWLWSPAQGYTKTSDGVLLSSIMNEKAANFLPVAKR